jgi:hypothetical protein
MAAAQQAAARQGQPQGGGTQNISLVLLLEKLKPQCNPEECVQLEAMYVELKVRGT